VTDPDSRSIPIGFGFVQGYNAQAAVNEQQVVLLADPMVTAAVPGAENSQNARKWPSWGGHLCGRSAGQRFRRAPLVWV
jgi:hypothetical protein